MSRWQHFTPHEMRDIMKAMQVFFDTTRKQKLKIPGSIGEVFNGRMERLKALQVELKELLETQNDAGTERPSEKDE